MRFVKIFIIILFCIASNIKASTIYGSLSLRNAKLQPNPIDYEIEAGLRGELYLDTAYGKYERENGNYYRGLYIQSKESQYKPEKSSARGIAYGVLDGWSAKIHISEADSINDQIIYKTFFNFGYDLFGVQSDILKLRASGYFDTWRYQGNRVGAYIDFTTSNIITDISYDTDLLGDFIFETKLSYEILLDGLTIKPNFKYQLRPDNKYIQSKIEIIKQI